MFEQNKVNGNDIHWLDNIAIAKWVQAFFPKVRFNVKFIGIPDVLNWIRINRHELPITTITQMVHESMQGVSVQHAAFRGNNEMLLYITTS